MSELSWLGIHWPRPVATDSALELLRRLASERRRPPVVFEAIGQAGKVSYRLGMQAGALTNTKHLLTALVLGIAFDSRPSERPVLDVALRLRARHAELGFDTAHPIETTRAVLTALSAARENESLMLQVTIGGGHPPQRPVARPVDPTQGFMSQLVLGPREAQSDSVTAMRKRLSEPSLDVYIRLSACADSVYRMRDLLRGLTSALHTAEGTASRFYFTGASAGSLDQPPRCYRVPMTVPELVGLLGLPLDELMPGVASPHPKLLRPKSTAPERARMFGLSTALGETVKIGQRIEDGLQHLVVTGPTGSGKSNLFQHLIRADLDAGRGVVLIDPKSDLAMDTLAVVPKHRLDDVVVLDPCQLLPVGLNPLSSPRSPELVADGILTIFRDLYPSMFGPRTADVLHSALLALAVTQRATLAWLPRLLTEPAFRERVVAHVEDEYVRGFWTQFDSLSDQAQAQFVGPVLSRLRQFLLRPQLRRVLDQAEPRFDLAEVFTKRKILIVPLNSGVLGNDASRLLGSLLVSSLWNLALASTNLPASKRHPVSIYIDEAQEFLRLGGELPDALARSRSLGVAWHLAHQYREQFAPEVRAAIDANGRSKVTFALGAADAKALATMAPELQAEDFMALPRFNFYAQLIQDGQPSPWVSGVTSPPPAPINDPAQLLRLSQMNYGARAPEPTTNAELDVETDEDLGRRKRS